MALQLELDEDNTSMSSMNKFFVPIKLGGLEVGVYIERYVGGWGKEVTYRTLFDDTCVCFSTLEELATWINENPAYLDACKQPGE